MDGLHEDLNRIKKKPYVEGLDMKEGESEMEYAAAEWDRYQQRNKSCVVDLMRGQLKSHLICPITNKEAVKFDPYVKRRIMC
jgi:ubiquitin carboxyl-terminal hydrolase 4/11/15